MYEYHFFLEPYKMDSKKAVMSNLLNFAKKWIRVMKPHI